MSIYGDYGNILAIQNILDKLGWKWVYQTVEIGQKLPKHNDFIFIGGGQDQDQIQVADDLMIKKYELKKLVEDGTCLLAICGGYQLLGEEFVDGKNNQMQGLGIFPVKTKSLDSNVKSRCIGNLVVECDWIKSKLVGFENHGGQTYFLQNQTPIGKVLVGFGNNFEDKLEGCVYKNAIGTYLHGSCLPKNPELTLWFINQTLESKKNNKQIGYEIYYMIKKANIDISIAQKTKENLINSFTK